MGGWGGAAFTIGGGGFAVASFGGACGAWVGARGVTGFGVGTVGRLVGRGHLKIGFASGGLVGLSGGEVYLGLVTDGVGASGLGPIVALGGVGAAEIKGVGASTDS